jgi:peptide/nickel transport system permease protein
VNAMNERRLHWTFYVGATIVGAVVVAAVFAPWLAPFGPRQLDLPHAFGRPGAVHLLGAGDNGVDILSQLVFGARISLSVGVTAVLIAGTFGTLLGTTVGYLGGLADEVVMRFVDILLAFPGILLAIFLTSVFGASMAGLIFALSATAWVGYARLARAQALSLRRRDFVTAARAAGASNMRIVVRHLLPNLLAPVIVQATLGLPGTILAEAALSFLGLGVPPGTPSWGALVDQGAAHLLDAPHVALMPGAAIAITVLGLNFVGETLRERLSPRGG